MDMMYDKGRERFKNGQTRWLDDKIVVYLVSDLPLAGEFASDLRSEDVIAGPVELVGKTFDEYVARAKDTVFTEYTIDKRVRFIVLAHDTGAPDKSPLLARINCPHPGLRGNMSNARVLWDTGPNGIMRFSTEEIYHPSAQECASSPHRGRKEQAHGQHSV